MTYLVLWEQVQLPQLYPSTLRWPGLLRTFTDIIPYQYWSVLKCKYLKWYPCIPTFNTCRHTLRSKVNRQDMIMTCCEWIGLPLAGLVSFVEANDKPDADEDKGKLVSVGTKFKCSDWQIVACLLFCAFGSCAGDGPFRYKVDFSLELICQPAAPLRVIDVQCSSQVIFQNRSASAGELPQGIGALRHLLKTKTKIKKITIKQ